METNNSRLDSKSTDDTKDKKEAKIAIFLFITVSLLFSCFYYFLEAGLLFSVVVPFMIGWVISKSFFGIGLGELITLVFESFTAIIGIGFFLMVLLGLLTILYHISTGTSIGDNFTN